MTVNYDYDRSLRIGMPEAILCEGKDDASLVRLLEELAKQPDHPVLFTRLSAAQHDAISKASNVALDYDSLSRTAIVNGSPPARAGSIAVVTAGTCDLPTAHECLRTLEFSGIAATLFADVGVAGLWRLTDRIEEIRQHSIVIVVAGMDAALVSVMGGLVAIPVIGVPSSVGYGVAAGGETALNSMLASCGQGIAVTNIDNGFGGACAAIRILNSFVKDSAS